MRSQRQNRLPARARLRLLAALGASLHAAAAAEPGAAVVSAEPVLARYVAAPEPDFGYALRTGGHYRGAEWVELILTSQRWRGLRWRHQLYLIRPADLPGAAQQALLFIDGGKWRDEYERPPAEARLPKRADVYLSIANRLRAPVAVLKQVPNQPLFDGLKEDALIAYTLDEYLRTGDPDWPLLLPMVKSAVRAMDAVQAYAAERWSLEISGFTVTGASKRGWTTWLTAAVDERVRALAPMVFDVLNMPPQLDHQRETWGVLSEQIADYEQRGITARLATPAGERLLDIVDPYRYRASIRQPKVVILGTNDPYWPVDSARLYWGGLTGERQPVYVPNAGHKLTDLARIVGAINAVHQHTANGRPLPDLRWQWHEKAEWLELTMTASPAPVSARAWIARSASRDFRAARWRAERVYAREGRYVYAVPRTVDGYVAMFGEAVFGRGDDEVALSTVPAIAGPSGTTASR